MLCIVSVTQSLIPIFFYSHPRRVHSPDTTTKIIQPTPPSPNQTPPIAVPSLPHRPPRHPRHHPRCHHRHHVVITILKHNPHLVYSTRPAISDQIPSTPPRPLSINLNNPAMAIPGRSQHHHRQSKTHPHRRNRRRGRRNLTSASTGVLRLFRPKPPCPPIRHQPPAVHRRAVLHAPTVPADRRRRRRPLPEIPAVDPLPPPDHPGRLRANPPHLPPP
ncbi:uncharacterized protein M6B38_203725 [Iris pallida]|uniref:Uncharacterized protein n=1 Tax=Iris pallida TaxID=29817 RepID=A0AAX6E6X4_IRIPA|nr:uncharacterized protein M6B38_203725 [Iris pallida]